MVDRESRRVHISGLNPSQCSLQDLKSRFDSFQLHVSDIYNWPPGKDAVGNIQNWCFLTLEGEAAKINRAVQVLKGTVWKGSTLRIGTAKGQGISLKAEGSAGKVGDVTEEKEKVKRKSRRVESASVHTPVKSKDVEEGLWGWYKTPAGHLVRPIHTRPDHPLPRPGARPIEKSGEESKKRKRRSFTDAKPLNRAKRVTLDPSRYGSRHLSELMLDDGSEALPRGYEWRCEEGDGSGDVEWSLIDSKGSIIRTERVSIVGRQDSTAGEEEEGNTDDYDDDSAMKDLEDAFDNASSASSSDEDDEEVEKSVSLEKGETHVTEQVDSRFDPGDESDFSEGYQEMQPEGAVPVEPWQDEKNGQIGLLKRMFGTLPQERVVPVSNEANIATAEKSASDGEDTEQIAVSTEVVRPTDSIQDAALTRAQKRAALLKSLTPTSGGKPRNFDPIVRFDPGLNAGVEQESRQVDGESNKLDIDKIQISVAPAAEMVEEPNVPTIQMASLKDMFRPKEDSAGFSLLADLDLDLEEESEEGEEEEEEELADSNHTTPLHRSAPNATLAIPALASTSTSTKLPLFFPTFDGEDRSWFGILQKDPSIKPFRRDKTDEEIQAIWNERKRTLTQEYKRRHREALKKKKRRYTGSRAATNALSM